MKIIVVSQTPFHVKAALTYLQNKQTEKVCFVLSKNLIGIRNLPYVAIFYSLSTRFRLSFTSLNIIKSNRRVISEMRNEILSLNESFNWSDIDEIVIGTDRELFNLLVYDNARENGFAGSFVLLDEGVGMYVERSFKYRVLAPFYFFLFFIIYGIKKRLVRPIGSSGLATFIGLRYPDLLKYNNKKSKYFLLPFSVNKTVFPETDSILVFSFVEDAHGISLRNKLRFYETLNNLGESMNRRIYVKPHPREEWKDQNFTSLYLLDKTILGEEIEFNSLRAVIHFNSSIVMNLMDGAFKGSVLCINTPLIKNLSSFGNSEIKVEFENVSEDLLISLLGF